MVMQIVIDMDVLDFEVIKEVNELGGEWKTDIAGKCMKAIANGIPLPKNHGRLIDADNLEGIRQLQLMPNGNGKYVEQIIYTQNAIDCAKTVIPADKEVSE